jgi:apoptosis-inducing factor 3
MDFANVMVLRSHNDQEEIKRRCETAKCVVILGSGFIGSESASALKLKYKDELSVSLVGLEQVPLQRQFGVEVGKMLISEHEKNGVKLHMGRKVTEIRGADGNATSVILDDGTELAADLVLVGAGVLPATKFLQGSGIEVDQWGGVICDPFLQTSAKDVFAAGDIASYPYWMTGRRMRIEHYMTSMDQGSYSAFNMLGKMTPFGNVPFYWTRHYNKAVQYIGHAHEFDEVHIQGDVLANKFVAFYIKDGKVLAVAGQQNGAAVLTYMEAMHQNQMPSAEAIKSGKETAETLRAKLKQNKGASRCRRENCCHKKEVAH